MAGGGESETDPRLQRGEDEDRTSARGEEGRVERAPERDTQEERREHRGEGVRRIVEETQQPPAPEHLRGERDEPGQAGAEENEARDRRRHLARRVALRPGRRG